VRGGENAEARRRLEVDDVVGRTRHSAASNWQVRRHSRNQSSCARHRHDLIDGGVNGVEELQTEVRSPIFGPATCQTLFSVRLVLTANLRIHRRCSSASARRRTSSQGTPADCPDITRRAGRSISAAQAASTSAGCSASASSRLAKSSAATSARSSRGRASASRRSACARDGMRLSTPRSAAQHVPDLSARADAGTRRGSALTGRPALQRRQLRHRHPGTKCPRLR